METKKLLPIEVENQKEMFGGWSWNSGDNRWDGEIPEVEIIGGGGGADWGDFWRDFDPGNEYPDYGGGSTGGNDNGGGKGYSYLRGDVPDPCHQSRDTGECTMLALDVVSKYFGGDKMGIHKDDFAESIGYDRNSAVVDLMHKGLLQEQISQVIDNFFINNSIDGSAQSIANALDAGKPIYGVIKTGEAMAHAIIITGYHSETNVIVAKDPLAGKSIVIDYDPTQFLSQTAISGFKNNDIVNKYKKDSGDWWKGCKIK